MACIVEVGTAVKFLRNFRNVIPDVMINPTKKARQDMSQIKLYWRLLTTTVYKKPLRWQQK